MMWAVIPGVGLKPSQAAGPLLAHWPLDAGSAVDSSGNGNNGSLLNGPSQHPGKIGQAMSFDGLDDLILIDNPSFDGQNSLSISAWVYPRSNANSDKGFVLGGDHASVYVEYSYKRVCFTSDLYRYGCTPFDSLSLDRWTHVAVVRDVNGGSMDLYLDGVKAVSSLWNNTPPANYRMAIGNHPNVDGGARPFTGLIDDVRVYSGLLSQSEIQGIVNGSSSPAAPSSITSTTGPKPESVTIGSVSGDWKTVALTNLYTAPVIACTAQSSVASVPAAVQVRGVTSSSFQIRLGAMALAAVTAVPVHCLAVEEGSYNRTAHGVTMEAVRYASTRADGSIRANGVWQAERRSYLNSYTRPVVLGQVMTANDSVPSVFWARGATAVEPPSPIELWVGRHSAEAPRSSNVTETVGYIVMEASEGDIGGLRYEAGVTGPLVIGVDYRSPHAQVMQSTSGDRALLSSAGMRGEDGGWPILSEAPLGDGKLQMEIDEDTLHDPERAHVQERVAYASFGSGSGSAPSEDPMQSFDFTLSGSGSVSGAQGTSVSAPVWATLTSGSTASVSFSVQGLPSQVSASFSSSGCVLPCSTNLALSIGGSAAAGQYALQVRGAADGLVRTTQILLSISAAPAQSGTGKGGIRLERAGENGGAETAPRGTLQIDSRSVTSQKQTEALDLSGGAHTIRITDVNGLEESLGQCTYPVGGTVCSVSNFGISPTCDGSICTAPVSVQDGRVTRVVAKYLGRYEGFAGGAVGGRSGKVIHVKNLNSSGAGSFEAALDEACEMNNRYIVFDVGGEIVAGHNMKVCGRNVTVDGYTAPSPIILRRTGIEVSVLSRLGQERYAENMIIRGLTIRKDGDSGPLGYDHRGASFDSGNSHYKGSRRVHNVVFANNSVSGAVDDMVSVARGTHDLTLMNNVFSYPLVAKHMYLQHDGFRVSLIRNIMSGAMMRVPAFFYHNPPSTTISPDLNGDVRNNLIGLSQYQARSTGSTTTGTIVARGSKANIIGNFYVGLPASANNPYVVNNAVIVCNPFARWTNPKTSPYCGEGSWSAESARAGGGYSDGNVVKSAYSVDPETSPNLLKTQSTPYPVPAGRTSTAQVAACEVLAKAGTGTPDAHDRGVFNELRTEVAKFVNCAGLGF